MKPEAFKLLHESGLSLREQGAAVRRACDKKFQGNIPLRYKPTMDDEIPKPLRRLLKAGIPKEDIVGLNTYNKNASYLFLDEFLDLVREEFEIMKKQ